jgi:hypothetical protein
MPCERAIVIQTGREKSRALNLSRASPSLILSVRRVRRVKLADRSVICFDGSQLNSVNQLIFVMVKCGVLFEVRTEFLNNI